MSLDETPQSGQESARAYTPAQEASIRFLEFIFGNITGGYAEFHHFGPGRNPKALSRPSYLEIPLETLRVSGDILRSVERESVLYGPAPRYRVPKRGGRGKDGDILQVGSVWAKINYEMAAGGAVEVIERIRSFPLRPSITVSSGYGYQLYFVFHSPLLSGKLTDWIDIMRDLRAVLRMPASINLSQMMRLPGTYNLRENVPVLCEVWDDYSSWVRYGVDEVREAVINAQSRLRSSSPQMLSEPQNSSSVRIRIPPESLSARGVDNNLLETIITGRLPMGIIGYDASSGRDFWVASSLYEIGFTEEEIKDVFRSNPQGCGSNWARKKRAEDYLDATLRKVRTRQLDKSSIMAPDDEQASNDDYDLIRKVPPDYVLGQDGSVWFTPPVTDEAKRVARPVMVCVSQLLIAEILENVDTGQISFLISFEYLGKKRETLISRAQMSNSRQLVTALAEKGAPVTSNNARHVLSYLTAFEQAFNASIPHKQVTSRFGRGRTGGPFFLPGLSSSVQFSPAGSGDASLYRAFASRQGSLKGWVRTMQELVDNSLLIPQVAILSAFVPPLQRRLQIPNFILDLYGNTSTGKSTSLRLAASVYGRPLDPDSLVQQWMNTQTAIEQFAGICSELPIFLDDAQHCPAELKRTVVYMIANGRGKGRSGGAGMLEAPTWYTVALSTSEEPLHEASPHEGARGRILPLGGASPPFPSGMASLVHELERVVMTNHGHAGEAFIRHLNGWGESQWRRLQRRYSDIRAELLRVSSSDVVGRVSSYIAAIQLAAEVAIPLLGLPFKADVIGAWLMLHLEEQQSDQNLVFAALRALADYYVSNVRHFAGDGQYEPKSRGSIHGVSRRGLYVAFLRSTIDAVFRPRKWNQTAVLGKLAEAGALYATEGERFTKKVGVAGVSHRMVCIKWQLILPGDTSATFD
jgi:hypothetical protein